MSIQLLSGSVNSYTGRSTISGVRGFVFSLLFAASPVFADDSGYIPYIESLQIAQTREHVRAAPSGMDQPLAAPAAPLTVQSTEALFPEESRLEELSDEKKGPVTLDEEQQSQALEQRLEQFGYDIFNRAPTTFAPVEGIPVPADYIIGPGDNIVVQLYGKKNVEYKLVVTRDGNILIPEYGPVQVAGLTFNEAEQILADGFSHRVIGARAAITMGKLRTIQVRLAGDVNQPGIYTLGGLSTLVDALLTTGGAKGTGTLRNIRLIRNEKVIAQLDLYDLLLRGRSNNDLYLAHNDTIFVPPIGDVVYVGGEVQRPAIYELKNEESVGEILKMAGGLLPTASLTDSHIERIQQNGTRTLVDFSRMGNGAGVSEIEATTVRNGDLLRVLALKDDMENVVLLSGHVKRPGGYQYREGMRLSQLVRHADDLLPGADIDVVLIEREDPATLRTNILYGYPMAAINTPGSEQDLLLKPRDKVTVFNLANERSEAVQGLIKKLEIQATSYRPARIVNITGAVRFDGALPLENDARLLDVMAFAGGITRGTEIHYGIIARTLFPSREIETRSFSIAAAQAKPISAENPEIAPGDRLYFFTEDGSRSELLNDEIDRLRQQASFGADENLVHIVGEVRHPGTYPLQQAMRASDLLCAARGLTTKANGLEVTLSRTQYSAGGDNAVEHSELNSGQLLRLCNFSRKLRQGATGKSDPKWISYIDDGINPVLEPRDQLSFSEKPGWVQRANVQLKGEVNKPGIYAIDEGETLCEVLKRAGGLTSDAYAFGAYFTRESVRSMQQSTIDELHDQLDDLMVELSLSHSYKNNEKTSEEWSGKQDYLKTIQQLEKAQATGRLVINLDKARKCRGGSDFALEDGDTLTIPREPDYVQVSGQVYVPTSHLYEKNRKIKDYIELSGGNTVLGRIDHAYVIQANGEVLSLKGGRSSSRVAKSSVMPGARIYVPINVDRMNGTEKAQSWVSSLVQSAILAGVLL